ncbi:hypothetical protein EYF80_049046 [Liparis tanakae]|uniref:Uncharacterized protein n=1 Tax=Liparis tanakae TaxID=230148 RepID=A0A4Z2FHR2_9TELE|nr:hypothetical protein EYF80_049046 [Liparis tanakae]
MLGPARCLRLRNRKYFNLLSGSDDQRHIVQSTSQVTLYCLRYAYRQSDMPRLNGSPRLPGAASSSIDQL